VRRAALQALHRRLEEMPASPTGGLHVHTSPLRRAHCTSRTRWLLVTRKDLCADVS
jgi:hypothetical protein